MVKLRTDAPHQIRRPHHLRQEAKTRNDAPTDRRKLAVFALDGALTTRDSLLPFLLFFARRQRRWRAICLAPFLIAAKLCRLCSDHRAKQLLVRLFIGGEQESTIDAVASEFSRCWLPKHLRDVGMEKLREHQDAGDRIILVTANTDIYAPRVAQELGIEEVVSAKVLRQDNRIQGWIVGDDCSGCGTLEYLADHLHDHEAPKDSYAYGSRKDLPLLRWVRHGYLVGRNQLVAIKREVDA